MPTAIGDVVPALVAVFTAALAARTGLVVYSGPRPNADYPTEYVTVGWDPEGGDGVTNDQDVSDMGNRWVDETGDAICSIVCWSGDDDTAPLLAAADDILDLLDAALAADPRLGEVLAAGHFARVLGRQGMAPTNNANGSSVRLTFTVHYTTVLV